MESSVRRSGWVTLVGILFLIAGFFNLIWGVVALGVSLGGTDATVMGDLSAGNLEGLGIAGVIVGGLQLIAGGGILARNPSARVLGMAMAVIAVLLNFGYHHALDGWAFSGLFVNLLIIVILAVKGEDFA
jgi:hypothetical protein